MKIELTKELESALASVFEKIFEEKKDKLNNGNIVDVLEEISTTGSRLFLKMGLEVLSKANIKDMPQNIFDLIEEL